MKKLALLFFILFSSIVVFAQNAEIEVSYNYTHADPSGKTITSIMTLISNQKHSKFYNILNEQVDSMMSTPEGRMAYGEMVQDALAKKDVTNLPVKKEPMYVIKSRKDNTISVYDLVGADFWTYTETLEKQNWSIQDSIKNILGYECLKAECEYRGRKWIVWFTTDIPLSDGPWKLNGLPGLILSAEDSANQYSFIANGITLSSRSISPIFGEENYEKTERLKYLEAKRAFTNNPAAYLEAATGAKINNMPHIEVSKSYDFLETDYHK